MALTQVSTKGIKDGTILNEDISNSAAINASKVSGLSTDSITEGNSKVEVVDTGSNGYVTTVVDGTETIRTVANSTTINYARIGANWDKESTSGTGISIGDGGNSHDIIASSATNGLDLQSNAYVAISQNGFPNQDYANFSSSNVNFFIGGNVKLQINSSGLTTHYSILPNTDSTLDIGTNTNRFANIYADTLYGSGANLTNIPDSAITGLSASKLTGALPAIDGSNLTGVAAGGANNISFNSGNGISFAATPDGTGSGDRSELLDDYETGYWTGTIDSGSATISGEWYVKIGKLVIGGGSISAISDTSSSNPIKVNGLPFSNTGGFSGSGAVSASKNNKFSEMVRCYVSGTTVRFITSSLSTGSNDYLRHSSMVQSSGSITFGFNYRIE